MTEESQKGGKMGKKGYVYILTNKYNKVLYTGVTSNLENRVFQHKTGIGSKFTKKYNCHKLVYYIISDNIESAIMEEKRIKGLLRRKKIELIESMNPNWIDLSKGWDL